MTASCLKSRKGFTLLEILITIGIVALLVAVLVPTYAAVQRAVSAKACVTRLRLVADGLDRYRAENRVYPRKLVALYPQYVKSRDELRCPRESRKGIRTYEEFYVPRLPVERGKATLTLTCPLHQHTGRGVEVFLDNNHERGETLAATLTSSQEVSLLRCAAARPADTDPTDSAFWAHAETADQSTKVEPGDWLRVPSGTTATLNFADTSRAEVTGPAEIMVADAFRTSHAASTSKIYTLLRLVRGRVYNVVHPGSKYEIVTPTGTAGARGTEFLLDRQYMAIYAGARPQWWITVSVYEGKVRLAGQRTYADLSVGRAASLDEAGRLEAYDLQ